ncbi:phosphoglucomutase (alpha-D-glucose-1,6-bisphosphate-dependent) [Propionimicrobium lymphophilum]|uniref:phosphoglucomutase (alpha-D-glucose-1,6-bisphosphate-dependent) n=1 Tax=Propionimicrobium lymphophilum TaxID=33012 RepID=UPI00254B6018|nr:phosphoglucomutase (alpha-D-glucose-1,6-bisphosphate-dependent) [Propionimicrobium lymphophilum]MDK7710316.1 phosphoglucomutase (alpha-D-glucose-1,6-bisphosphate-dependent) [Propionimicrobium lymphophilum]MDK7734331.1 phosphoglucomutase (alpha-D-glucose-1,6-bisphosphate-dependent) [Propionimicrobium lymphophilum]
MAHPRAGKPAEKSDLIDVDALLAAYYDLVPDVSNPDQAVVFGTSGHRGSAFDGAFNEAHITAITAAIIEYRASQGITGPLFIAKDTHGLSLPAWKTAIEVLVAAGIEVFAEREDEYTPTPALSRAIIRYNREHTGGPQADGIVVTPSHNPPRDGGFKYNPQNGGPADTDATSWIADRANELVPDFKKVKRIPYEKAANKVNRFDYRSKYCEELSLVVDIDKIKSSGLRIGADPMGGASAQYWEYISENLLPNLTVVNRVIDPTWYFMTLDTDGKIRMDCSSPNSMASLVHQRDKYDIATGNDADADRHGIVTPDAGLMNPNHYLAVAIEYLFGHRPGWPVDTKIGKTLVSSSMIDNVAKELGRTLVEVPVGFKWFVPGLISGELGFGGEESAGASFLEMNGSTWTTDKDGIILDLLASEITAVTGKTPSQRYAELAEEFGEYVYQRIDSDASREEKARLKALSPEDIKATELAGKKITNVYTNAPGNDAPIGGIKVTTDEGWFAARPSGTENKYKIYAESYVSENELSKIQDAAKEVVSEALEG